jgi:hypothetical protein
MKDYLFAIICFLIGFLIWKSYLKWLKFKYQLYQKKQLEVWDYRLKINFIGGVLIACICGIIFLLRALIFAK